jgi:predicted enzyme related to lactoylglutathione lyase
MKMCPVVHFEMPYEDPKRLAEFYESVFGWEMRYLPEMGSYVLATTSPVDENQMHKEKGAINGGFYPKGDYGKAPHLVISVDDLDKNLEMVKKGGGKIEGEPMDIPGVGRFVMLTDTEGNRIGMLQSRR